MFDSIKQLQRQYELLCARMEEPSTYSDPAAYSKYEREARELQPIVNAYTEYQQADSRMQEALELMGDSEMRELAQERGVNKSTVCRTLQRAERRMRRCLRY